jgi:UDP-N-acetylmuramoyl-L-alanyl-D-glutamate--2,6-diaminopimelate ligase
VKLDALVDGMEGAVVIGTRDPDVARLAYDSRRVARGDLFFALAGAHHDGRAFVPDAVARGASAVVTGQELSPQAVPVVVVPDARRALAEAACRLYSNPSRALRVVGVTGTNGKTTITYLVEHVFRRAGLATGLIGTTGIHIRDQRRPSDFTTPEAPELQQLLREMADHGVEAVALEVSSHALDQRRSLGLECDVAVFTNLSHEHLDYHGTLERYLDAKLMLFDGRNRLEPVKAWYAVVNADDPVAPQVIAAARRGGGRISTYGRAPDATVGIGAVEVLPGGLSVALVEAGRTIPVAVPLLGRHNAWNAAAAFASARALHIDAERVAAALASAPPVPGRLERVQAGQPYEVVVDYAHTPDALEKALAAAREHARGRVLLVFGCGGDRDRAKRPLMGATAQRGSDRAWITSDNPRSEDPARIADEVAAGMSPHGSLGSQAARIVLDRRLAIAEALAEARPGDLVVIAGKGHETTQTIGDRVLPFDDRVVARELIVAAAGGR